VRKFLTIGSRRRPLSVRIYRCPSADWRQPTRLDFVPVLAAPCGRSVGSHLHVDKQIIRREETNATS